MLQKISLEGFQPMNKGKLLDGGNNLLKTNFPLSKETKGTFLNFLHHLTYEVFWNDQNH